MRELKILVRKLVAWQIPLLGGDYLKFISYFTMGGINGSSRHMDLVELKGRNNLVIPGREGDDVKRM